MIMLFYTSSYYKLQVFRYTSIEEDEKDGSRSMPLTRLENLK
jgi:hypothetical protein